MMPVDLLEHWRWMVAGRVGVIEAVRVFTCVVAISERRLGTDCGARALAALMEDSRFGFLRWQLAGRASIGMGIPGAMFIGSL